MDGFEKIFNPQKASQEPVQHLDATATQNEELSTEETNPLPQDQEQLQPEASEVSTETTVETAKEEQVEEVESTPEVDYKHEYENAEKRRRDLQSHYDSQINELKKEIASMKQDPQPEQPKKPEINKDEFNDKFFDDPMAALEMFAQQFVGQQQQPQMNPQDLKLQIQEEAQRSLHDDFDAVLSIAQKAAMVDPELVARIQQSPNPALTAYQEGKKLEKAYKIQQDPEAYEAELRKKWEEENKPKNDNPGGLRKIPNSAPNPRTVVKTKSDKESFNAMFGGKKGRTA